MKWTSSFIFTSRKPPADAETVSQKLMHQAGMIDKLISGVYSYLPLGLRVLKKVSDIIREEMNKAGAIEILMPGLQPASLWKKSKRFEKMGKDMIVFKDRHNREMLLGPTHEEVVSDIVKKYLKSWKNLPVMLYQIQTKFRDEIRPRFGIIRSREFLMKDCYSFDRTDQESEQSYFKMKEAYLKIFERCGLSVTIQTADSGVIGGKFSEEFVAAGDCAELEIGHIFKLGTDYSEKLNVVYVDNDGSEKPVVMGCYGIGVSRVVAAIIEGNYDEKGIIWPVSVAPFTAIILPLNMSDNNTVEIANKMHDELQSAKLDILLDDREESAGVKFADADLIGIPYRIILGRKIAEGKVEIVERKTKRSHDVGIENVRQFFYSVLRNHA
ncbi:MAG: proline--tRNA ligase [Candidatus Omnitrophica bacterium]|nr:proline--tRNA ligase [Candidatus Omnitrophota bacterium]MCM8825664.1 proline--tRNA ligase [Candidatus Omnitrophota bacterium]